MTVFVPYSTSATPTSLAELVGVPKPTPEIAMPLMIELVNRAPLDLPNRQELIGTLNNIRAIKSVR